MIVLLIVLSWLLVDAIAAFNGLPSVLWNVVFFVAVFLIVFYLATSGDVERLRVFFSKVRKEESR